MKKIYKYKLKNGDISFIKMPIGAEILSVQVQNNSPHIWVLVDPDADLETRAFEIFGTGETIPDNSRRKFIGTYQLYGGEFVFHCFELIK